MLVFYGINQHTQIVLNSTSVSLSHVVVVSGFKLLVLVIVSSSSH